MRGGSTAPITYRLLYQVFPPIEAALAFGETTVAEFTDFIADTQTKITTVTDTRPVVTALEDEMQQVAVYVDVAYAVTDSVDQVATGLAGADRPGQSGNVVAHSAVRLSEVLHEATGTLDAAKRWLRILETAVTTRSMPSTNSSTPCNCVLPKSKPPSSKPKATSP